MDRSTQPSFNFVNLKHPDDLKSEETQLRIRRLAMTEVGKARRKPKTTRERNKIILELSNPPEERLKLDRLSGGQTDPFSAYPIEMDSSARALLANSGCLGPKPSQQRFVTRCSFQPQYQPREPTARQLVSRGPEQRSSISQCAVELSEFHLPEAQWILSFSGRCDGLETSSQGTQIRW